MTDKINDNGTVRADVKEALMNLLNSSSTGGNQYVTFNINDEEYGIEIKSVQEITGYRELTVLPNTPEYVKGILNLRGNVIPVMDPRIKFGMPEVEYDKTSVVIIFNAAGKTVGMIVDRISDVLTIDRKSIEETPDMAVDLNVQFLDGVGKVGEKFVILLDVSKIFSQDEIEKLQT